MNRHGGMSDIFLWIIISVVIVFVCGIFIFLGGKVNTELHNKLDGKMFGESNGTQIVEQSIGKVNQTYQSLYWISVFLIVGMMMSIFIGSYLVTTKPVFFIPYIFIIIIAVIVSVGISNAYEMVISDPTMADTFAGFVGANFIMLKLPMWTSIIGIVGGIIMFVRMGSRENTQFGGGF